MVLLLQAAVAEKSREQGVGALGGIVAVLVVGTILVFHDVCSLTAQLLHVGRAVTFVGRVVEEHRNLAVPWA